MSVTTLHRSLLSRSGIVAVLVVSAAVLVALASVGGGDPARDRAGSPPSTIVDRTEVPSARGDAGGEIGSVAPDSTTGAAGRAATADAFQEDATTSIAIGEPAPPTDPTTPTGGIPGIEPLIARTGSISMRVDRGEFESAWGDVHAVAGAVGGRVQAASRSGAGRAARLGTITLSVPSARFDRAIEDLRRTARVKVTRLDVMTEDVSEEYVDTKARLRHDRAVEGRLLALLGQTKGVGEVLAVQTRLDSVQEQIEISKGRMDYLQRRTSTSSITVSLRQPGAKGGRDDADPSTLRTAFDEARSNFVDNIAGVIAWTGGALPGLLLVALFAITGRVVWRRRSKVTGS